MPYYVRASFIDWHYETAKVDLQQVLSEANQDLSSTDHTKETFEQRLLTYAQARPDLVADALIEDGFRQYWLYRARGGNVTVQEVQERPERALDRAIDLPRDEIASVTLVRDRESILDLLANQPDFYDEETDEIELPTVYDSEGSLREIVRRVANAIDDGDHRFVAEIERDRFLVEISPRMPIVRKLIVLTEPELVTRLLHRRFADVPEPPPRADQKYEQALYFPEEMLAAIQTEARRLDRSLSNIVQRAWLIAHENIAKSNPETLRPLLRSFGGDKHKQSLFFPGNMLTEIRDQASRLDSSQSFVVQSAWALASATIAALPAP